jgi:hypothetical protein
MKTTVFRAVSCLAVLLSGPTSHAGPRTLDLSSPSGTKVSLTAPPGEVISFVVVNKHPMKAYSITVEERVIPVPVLPTPEGLQGLMTDEVCGPILAEAESLEHATDEAQVGEIVRRVRLALAPGICTDSAFLSKINEWLASTIHVVPEQFVVRAGAELVLTVTRDEKIWTLAVSGGERGLWLTTYGVSIVPSRDEPFFARASGENTFTVTAEEEIKDVRMIPSVFFSWLPRRRMLGDFSVGPTAGLGLSKGTAAVFGGVGVTYNWNLGFIAGAAVSPHRRLRGRYKAGDELTENLSDEQLNRTVFKPTWLVAMTFRFAGNPFGAGGDEGSEGTKADEKAAAGKKASKEKEKD